MSEPKVCTSCGAQCMTADNFCHACGMRFNGRMIVFDRWLKRALQISVIVLVLVFVLALGSCTILSFF